MTDAVRTVGRPRDPAREARNKARILDAATTVFAERGYADTRVQTIAGRLGVGNGTVYRYFPTKEKLFLAAVGRGLDELTAEMDAVLAAPDDPLAVMRNAIRGYLRFFHRRPEMAELFVQERATFRRHRRPLYFETRAGEDAKHAAFFRLVRDAGVVRDLPPERFFAVVADLLYGTVLTNLMSGRAVDPDAQADDVLDVIFHGVLTDPARKRLTKKEGKR